MRDDYSKFLSKNATITVVVRDDAEDVRRFWGEQKLPYSAIPDPEARVAERYGQRWKAHKLGLMPALFVVSREGIIVHVHYSDGMSDIPKNADILARLGG